MDVDYYIKILLSNRRTKLSKARLASAHNFVKKSIQENIPGSIVECGTYKGGCLALMAKTAHFMNSNKKIYGFDVFDHLPEPGEHDGKLSNGRGHSEDLNCTPDDVIDTLKLCGFDYLTLKLFPGLFQDTLTEQETLDEIGLISVLRLDGDWYESTKVCLDQLYDLVSVGGFVVIDDYGHFPGCKKAVDEFRERRGITSQLHKTDYTERWWIKE